MAMGFDERLSRSVSNMKKFEEEMDRRSKKYSIYPY